MKARQPQKQQRRLKARRDRAPKRDDFHLPGSLNPHKPHSLKGLK